jgi:hypothetical protein
MTPDLLVSDPFVLYLLKKYKKLEFILKGKFSFCEAAIG